MLYTTSSGIRINVTKFSAKLVCLEDIAHHLTKICRYGGALPLDIHYSVAEHSILLSRYALKHHGVEVAKAALLHDASEAYLGDIVSGLKKLLPDYKQIEHKVENIIKAKYKIKNDDLTNATVKFLDLSILEDEHRKFFPERLDLFKSEHEHSYLNVKIKSPRNLQLIKDEFLELCYDLNIRDTK